MNPIQLPKQVTQNPKDPNETSLNLQKTTDKPEYSDKKIQILTISSSKISHRWLDNKNLSSIIHYFFRVSQVNNLNFPTVLSLLIVQYTKSPTVDADKKMALEFGYNTAQDIQQTLRKKYNIQMYNFKKDTGIIIEYCDIPEPFKKNPESIEIEETWDLVFISNDNYNTKQLTIGYGLPIVV